MRYSFTLAFTTNADAANGLVFGKDIETWLIYTLVLLGSMSIAYLIVWGRGMVKEMKSGKSIKQPWD